MNPLIASIERKLESLPVHLGLVLPNGMRLGPPNPSVTLVAKQKKALAHLASGEVGLIGQDYVEGICDVQGSMRDIMAVAASILPGSPVEAARQGWLTGLISRVMSVWRHSIEKDAKQIEFHYDLSDDFYGLWLDPRRVYSCAYYQTPSMTLAQAQEAKLDLICRKLRLSAGERFLDVGAGWGGLLLWAAEHYGVDATGITLSRNQYAYVTRLIEEKGLGHRVRVQLLDYRKLDVSEPYDKIASVGMFEHVGRAQLKEYFSRLRELLRPGGLILNHGITAGGLHNDALGNGMGDFIEKYIFPGGELVHIGNVITELSAGGLEALDIENLRPHYARTLWAWSDALEARLDEAARVLPGEQGARALRAYRMYLAGCAKGFENGWVALHQVLAQHNPTGRTDELDEPADQAYPWRRDYIFRA
ncbi:class I SAM-dependent methyltransferase [Zwartia sp.]|uniref:class I SAM-dependent methyltransferase n=1 Tax=Zwartia sp. TaxID=2978004 RepID=UPI002729106A|nr:class I SAM-dependent methyltransferase [Zwartia sp.]MDO9023897.1 class I SAM-dependent methyltransferase [Zwartia sp.]